ncbi:MAG TPA: uracil-DNA glycosylase [Enteractinococcus helveticum]|uniref:Uracil-DNA glycosylase n=1 Tax=Enteractinococcus helveticum TaxID=1837282 RepID=A0A921FR99_9MICC|nr:uracil-DNA glycosylase [Enteractinococcus helveticum]HJF15737.1 uracil-DNA glycosylase [Enteractinococcus helveticum]
MTFSAWPEIHASWYSILEPVSNTLHTLMEHIASRRDAGEHIEPAADNVLRVFSMPVDQIKVLIVGQDPYPTPGHAVGLSFALDPHVRPLARSLVNIYKELQDDLGIAPADTGDLSGWEAQGVFLLNRVLTVTAHAAGSHRNLGWETITDAVIDGLACRGTPLVVILWGGQARTLAPRFTADDTLVLTAAHPSPLSARRGFFGSKPFSKTNHFLVAHGIEPIDWAANSHRQSAQSEQF